MLGNGVKVAVSLGRGVWLGVLLETGVKVGVPVDAVSVESVAYNENRKTSLVGELENVPGREPNV